MPTQLRRLALVSLAALALTGGAVATATTAAAAPPAAQSVSYPGPGADAYPDYDDDGEPLHFGPFDLPHSGQVSGGFSWNTRD